jgi:hypothetical protein
VVGLEQRPQMDFRAARLRVVALSYQQPAQLSREMGA